jgi:hypothetical protein
MGGGGH